jgi:hypothetical protein
LDPASVSLMIIGAIISAVISWVVARRFDSRPELGYITSSEVVLKPIEDAKPRLRVSFGNEDVRCVSRGRVALWHRRSGTPVDGTRINPEDPICITVPDGCRILEANVIALSSRSNSNSNPNGISLQMTGERAIELGFRHLDVRQGVVVEVFYDGVGNVGLSGEIPGVTIRRREGDLSDDALDRPRLTPKQYRRRAFKFIRAVSIFYLILFGLTQGIEWSSSHGPLHHQTLVNQTTYDLKSLSGQSAFAIAVGNHGGIPISTDVTPLQLFGAVFFMSLAVFLISVHETRKPIPHSVARGDDFGIFVSSKRGTD